MFRTGGMTPTAAVISVSCDGERAGEEVVECCWEEACEGVVSGLRMAAKSTADDIRCIGSRVKSDVVGRWIKSQEGDFSRERPGFRNGD
jgi:hypothetical protein